MDHVKSKLLLIKNNKFICSHLHTIDKILLNLILFPFSKLNPGSIPVSKIWTVLKREREPKFDVECYFSV